MVFDDYGSQIAILRLNYVVRSPEGYCGKEDHGALQEQHISQIPPLLSQRPLLRKLYECLSQLLLFFWPLMVYHS
jgi:hypothetical protein